MTAGSPLAVCPQPPGCGHRFSLLCFLCLRALLCLCPQKRRGAWANPCCRSLERYTQFDNWRSSCNQKPKPGSGLHAVAAGSSGVKLRFLIQRNSLDQEPEGWCRRKGRHREEQTTGGKLAREANSNQVTAFSEQGNGASSAEDRVWKSGR